MKQLLKALADFQEEVPVIHEETNGYNYTYSNINTIFDVIKPLLKKHGLAFYQTLNEDKLDTHIFHVEEGTSISSSIVIPKVKLGKMNEYQSLGSGITYLRRYSLSCMLGLITDKDIDGAGKEENTVEPKKKLDEKGFEYLMSEGKHKDIVVALNMRSMTAERYKDLENRLETIENK